MGNIHWVLATEIFIFSKIKNIRNEKKIYIFLFPIFHIFNPLKYTINISDVLYIYK